MESSELRILSMSVYEPLDFFAHVAASSTLQADRTFATYAKYLVAGICSQSGAERTSKYMVEVQGRKKATNLNLDKGRKMLELKMHLMHNNSVRKVHEKEQREGERSIADDLRTVYLAKRERAKEVAELKKRLSELRNQEKDEAEAEAEARAEADELVVTTTTAQLVTAADVDDVLGAEKEEHTELEPYELPVGHIAVMEVPPAAELVRFVQGVEAPSMVKKKIMYNYEGYNWLVGIVLRRNGDVRRAMHDGIVANFIVQFEIDEGRSTAMVLDAEDYSTELLAPFGAWFLLDTEEVVTEAAETEGAPEAVEAEPVEAEPAEAEATEPV
uniref:Uncharacterized protein n=1 Tax=Coccolithus braarudii TaxID=221442 RepID=A0A7S0Q0E0_9EUKA|mmetsp:Transcript_20449/g.43863  ORF Transcript_20449/g.43863 Transcript_20449/m.43863 type:complete len:329 (+) Transcript_20449:761-1747(+)